MFKNAVMDKEIKIVGNDGSMILSAHAYENPVLEGSDVPYSPAKLEITPILLVLK
jgi:hypothetical protein